MTEIEAVTRPPAPIPLRSLLLRRILAALIMVSILVAGIVIRILFPAERIDDDVTSVTSDYVSNFTTEVVTQEVAFTEDTSLFL